MLEIAESRHRGIAELRNRSIQERIPFTRHSRLKYHSGYSEGSHENLETSCRRRALPDSLGSGGSLSGTDRAGHGRGDEHVSRIAEFGTALESEIRPDT